MPQPTIEEIDEHLSEERLKDKRYFPISGWTIPFRTKYFNIDKWLEFRKQNKNSTGD